MALPFPRPTRTFPLDLTCLAPGKRTGGRAKWPMTANARFKSYSACLQASRNRKKHASLILDSARFSTAAPRGHLWSGRRPPEGAASSLSPKSGFAAPLELADPPRNILGIDRNPGPEPPKEQPIINAPGMYFRRTRGSKSSQNWEFAPKYVLQSTENGANQWLVWGCYRALR